ncbi:hypothetical protein K461DRAFT_289262 [Myriangium duriaei CBS 260.36]|uniref:Uncharacterized protein n=1 Tax=Myriangium duriaei CBS 260.36 TaxID=1168546 RepID=A0A9P4J8Q8_9PEZI|nr:hypothetical protein K461DRAFT_289262 [Myriangium duriaei CBS 260.36]
MSSQSPEQNTVADSNKSDSSSKNTGMFSNLSAYKRDPENPAYQQRRESLNEQSAQKPGVVGQMFDKLVRGEHPANN